MLHREKQGVHWLEFELLTEIPKLKHAIFLRHGGASRGDFASLNIGERVGDVPEHVAANRKKITEVLGLSKLVSSRMIHGKEVREVTAESAHERHPCDGMLTKTPGLGLIISHADCQVAILYDPVNHAVANVHSGWRGSVQNIYAEAVAQMRQRYGTNPADLLVGITPSLGPQRAEFVNYRDELPKLFLDFQIKPNYFDFWAISRYQLRECGVLPHHIEIAEMCTYTRSDKFFSYRRNKITGRHGTVVALK